MYIDSTYIHLQTSDKQHGILPNEDIRTAVQQISSLYKIKAEISNMDNGSNEVEAINKLLDITLNQSCSWVRSLTVSM